MDRRAGAGSLRRVPDPDDMCARLSPIVYDDINFLSSYAFTAPT